MTDPAAPLVEYPTHYVFKAMGLAVPGFVSRMRELVEAALGPLTNEPLVERPSSGGKYVSVSMHVYLKSEEERRRVYQGFHSEKAILWYV